MSDESQFANNSPHQPKAYDEIAAMLRRWRYIMGEIPTAITLPPKLFASLWKDVRAIAVVEERPGLFCEGFEPMDAGNPVIELNVAGAPVRIRCSEAIYRRDLESRRDE